MQKQITLESKKNQNAYDVDNYVSVKLEQNGQKIPYTNIEESINLQEVFTEERDACDKYKLTFTVNPICSNILYNMRTEIVQNEGASTCKALVTDVDTIEKPLNAVNTSTLNREQAIRDTEYSHPLLGNLKYHCGLDMFNNHHLRSSDFIYVGKVNSGDTTSKAVFNTLKDYKRDTDGNIVKEVLCEGSTSAEVATHLYDLSNTYSFETAFNEKMKYRDGWYGFINSGGMNIPNIFTSDNVIALNKTIAYNKPCEIYNMYPDRSLFSFNPKYNSYRKRYEYNWDYCLTYPYASDYSKFNTIMDNTVNAIKIVDKRKWDYTETKVFECFTSLIKHNLQVGDKVRFYYGNDVTQYAYVVTVKKLGDENSDNRDICFMVDYDEVSGFINESKIYFKKRVNDEECHYYVRQFKKLKNTSNEDYNSEVGKLFEENIYGDKMSQIIYTDSIDLNGLTDNLGRDVSEIYLTVCKTNRGYKKWYNENDNTRYNGSDVEYSHCFGKVTSGFDLGDRIDSYNVRKFHNIKNVSQRSIDDINGLWNPPTVLEDDLTINDFDVFYGDIVEFNIDEYKETVLAPVYHRVNTSQRECNEYQYTWHLFKDELVSDDYTNNFQVKNTTFGTYLQPEGYFYNPHTKVQVKEISEDVTSNVGYQLSVSDVSIKKYDTDKFDVSFKTTNDYEFLIGDIFCFYYYTDRSQSWGELTNIASDGTLTVRVYGDISKWSTTMIDIVLTDGSVPEYAIYKPIKQKFVWRETVLPSQVPITSQLYDRPFMNGCLYINTNANIYMRRQDPSNKFGLYDPVNWKDSTKYNSTHNFRFKGVEIAIDGLMKYIADFDNTCIL